ncbi:RNA polymerase sigma factor [Alienimonas chondri]|uniref:ECF RNA polymerase sigma factor SigW n=1 Tax=Alienimonas chondri TaxID=2681879 RepID=A0ABX1VDA2_9PLAN|nr:RNA polymerase sigma factor [Alienimonas chondri]NNJ25773.1 ECF RNA polymerase sigma factor SigW [Alienimonas chondri]
MPDSGEHRSPSDALAAAAASGDAAAWSDLVRALSPRLIGFLRSRGLRPAEAEDVAQDAWVRVLDRFDAYDRDRPFRPWLFQIAVNLSADRGRSDARRIARERHVAQEKDGAAEATDAAPHAGIERQETARAVAGCLEKLSEVERSCLGLRYREGLKNHEVADRLDVPKGTVDGAFSRGLKKMSACLLHADGDLSPGSHA